MIDWGMAGAVVATGLIVVFVILLILVAVCWLMSALFHNIGKNKKDKTEVKAEKKESKAVAQTTAPTMAVQKGIPNEVIAAISAAVACMAGGTKNLVIRSVKKAKENRNVWSAAGVAENTRPF